MKRRSSTLLFSISLAFAGLFFACNNEENELEALQDTYKDESQATKVFDGLNKLVEDEMQENSDSLGRVGAVYTTDGSYCPCSELTFNTSQKRITIDFKDGCLCQDGKKRAGKILIDYTGRYRDSGSVITTSTEGYVLNDTIEVKAQKTVTNKGTVDGLPTWEVQVSGQNSEYAELIFEASGTTQWKSTRTRQLIAGDSTNWAPGKSLKEVISDDEYQIYGTAEGISRKDRNWTAVVDQDQALIYKLACWFNTPPSYSATQGIIELTPENSSTTTIDYGTGQCDQKALVTFKGREFDVFVR